MPLWKLIQKEGGGDCFLLYSLIHAETNLTRNLLTWMMCILKSHSVVEFTVKLDKKSDIKESHPRTHIINKNIKKEKLCNDHEYTKI